MSSHTCPTQVTLGAWLCVAPDQRLNCQPAPTMSNVPVLRSITEPDFKGGAPANTPTEPARKPLAKHKMEVKALSQRQHRKSIPAAVLWGSGAGSQAKGKVGVSGPVARPHAFEGWSV